MRISQMNVEYIDHMGTDLTVVNAARVSFNKESEWVWDEEDDLGYRIGAICDNDVKLISYLAKHNHWSPFAHTSIQLRIKAPFFVARQLEKHQVGAAWNEVSRRYVDSEPEFWFPEIWRERPNGSLKQGSGGPIEDNELWGTKAKEVCNEALRLYRFMIDNDIAPEQARMVLPANAITEWYWTGSVMFFARVCKQRLDSHAQVEATEIAKMIDHFCRDLFPVSWKALIGDI